MINDLLESKFVSVTPPGAIVDNASYTTAEVDTLGYDHATFVMHLGASDVAMAALKLQESSTSGSGFADVSGCDFSSGTDRDGNSTSLPSATDDNSLFIIQVDLRGRERYLDLVATAGNGSTGTYMSAMCVLSKGEDAPTTVAGMGAASAIQL